MMKERKKGEKKGRRGLYAILYSREHSSNFLFAASEEDRGRKEKKGKGKKKGGHAACKRL